MKNKIIKTLLLTLAVAGTICAAEINLANEEQVAKEKENEVYSLYGRYYTNGTFIDVNGEIWEYEVTEIDGKPVYDGMPIFTIIWDNGTYAIEDDTISTAGRDFVTELEDKWND